MNRAPTLRLCAFAGDIPIALILFLRTLRSLRPISSLLAASPRALTSENIRQRSYVIDFLQAFDQSQGALGGFGA